jgi:Metal-dependent hydrolase
MTETRVLSYNVRHADADDGHDRWYNRRDAVGALLGAHAPDVFGLQEALPEQTAFLADQLPAYRLVDGAPDGHGEGCPIAWRRDRYEAVDDGMFWLSENPDADTPAAGWDARYPRIVVWVRLRGADGDIVVSNTHFDHRGDTAREESARLSRARLQTIAGDTPLLLLGDLNCTAGTTPHAILTERLTDAAQEATVRHGPKTSLTDFARLLQDRRIDYILVDGFDVEAFATLADRDDRGRYPSDHLPVLARLARP